LNGIIIYWNKKTEIVGYQIQNFKLYQVWNFALSKDETLFKTANWAYDHEESSFTGIIPEDMKVIYKFVDSNNFAVATRSSQGGDHLNLYIINGITGRVLASETQQYIDFSHPVNLVFDENTVFVTYFNPKELYYEFWITEFYHTHIESSIRVLVEKYLFRTNHEAEDANYNLDDKTFTAFTKKYYFAPGVKSLSVVQTKRGITKKNLIVVTSNDQVDF
jgi:ER membrane protein complex subunit 1